MTVRVVIPWEALVGDNRRMQKKSYGLTREYRHAKEAIAMIGMGQVRDRPAFSDPPITVRYDFHQPDFRQRDCANYLKLLNDAMEGILWADDWHIRSLSFLVHPPDGTEPRVVLTAWDGLTDMEAA